MIVCSALPPIVLHQQSSTAERARIVGAGGYIEYGRVNGVYSRIFPDQLAYPGRSRKPCVVKSAG